VSRTRSFRFRFSETTLRFGRGAASTTIGLRKQKAATRFSPTIGCPSPVMSDFGMHKRAQVPNDSRAVHDTSGFRPGSATPLIASPSPDKTSIYFHILTNIVDPYK
jgi:hypothetical protein